MSSGVQSKSDGKMKVIARRYKLHSEVYMIYSAKDLLLEFEVISALDSEEQLIKAPRITRHTKPLCAAQQSVCIYVCMCVRTAQYHLLIEITMLQNEK
jgi:hypothetical protein